MKKNRFPFYPFLIALFPVLALLSVNISQVPISYTWRAALISLAIGIVIFELSRLILRSWDKGALVASWLLILFFSYGHVFSLIQYAKVGPIDIGRHRYLLVAWILLAVLGIFLILKFIKNYRKSTELLNIISVVLVALPIIQMVYSTVKLKSGESTQVQSSISATDMTGSKPDVYYIILDAYSRQDMLQLNHSYDNSSFITSLKNLGFYVAPCSQSNYGMTSYSLASSLNMNYLEQINPKAVSQKINWTVFGNNMQKSLVVNMFKEMGYKTISFETGYDWSDVTKVDLFISRKSSSVYQNQSIQKISEFEVLFWRTTFFRFFDDYNKGFWYSWFFKAQSPEEDQYQRILFDLDQLEKTSSIEGPKFVYLHLTSPHEPYVIDANGNFFANPDHATGYLQQVSYLDNRIPEILNSIITNSKVKPVIILQADHGDEWKERMAILNAYYLPGVPDNGLYPTITPVNTFRLVFDKVFGQSLPLLPDESYLSQYDQDYYNFTKVDYGCNLAK